MILNSYIGSCLDETPKLIREIGRGGYSVVYLAVWRGSIAAAKVLMVPSTSASSAMKEAEIFKYYIIILCLTNYRLN